MSDQADHHLAGHDGHLVRKSGQETRFANGDRICSGFLGRDVFNLLGGIHDRLDGTGQLI